MPAELARSTMKIYKKLLRSKIEEVTTQTRCTDRSHKGGIRDRRTAWSAAQRYTKLYVTMALCTADIWALESGFRTCTVTPYELRLQSRCNKVSKSLCTPCTHW